MSGCRVLRVCVLRVVVCLLRIELGQARKSLFWPLKKNHARTYARGHNSANDDDELPLRASAVLKSRGAADWSRGRPGPLWARTNSRSVRGTPCGKIWRGRWWGGGVWRHRAGVLVVFFSVCKWGEGPVTAHKGSVFVRRASARTFAR